MNANKHRTEDTQGPIAAFQPLTATAVAGPDSQAPATQTGSGNGRTPPPPPARRRRAPENDPAPEGPNWTQWLIDANPLYLVSVMFMFLGLLLVSRETAAPGSSVETVMLFYGIQNLYEIAMVGMGIYLLRTSTNARHGKILLLFVLVFMADLTFYQVHISSLNAKWGMLVSAIYLLTGAVKLGAVVHLLEITPRWERLFFPITAFAIIYFAPQYVYHSVDAVGRSGAAGATTPFSGVTEIYFIWLLAALIQLPLIVSTWRESDLAESVSNKYLGTERPFYWTILLFPLAVLPFQLLQNVMADARAANGAIADMAFVYVPFLLAAGFFLQAFARGFIRQEFGQNTFDFGMLMAAFVVAFATQQPGEVLAPLGQANVLLTLAAHIAVVVSRQNLYSAGFLTLVVAWQFLAVIKLGCAKAAKFLLDLSGLAWAGILMSGSFVTLGLGFLLSLRSGRGRPNPPAAEASPADSGTAAS